MKATELRIGNIVQGGTILELHSERAIVSGGFSGSHGEEYKDIVGIKITPDWLIKFGLEKCENGYTWGADDGDFGFAIDNEDTEFNKGENDYWYFNKMGAMEDVSIKFIHELQNLYFALIGEELQINVLPKNN